MTLGGQSLSNRQTVFFLLVDPMDKNHKDLDTIDLRAPRLAQYMHKAWKKHHNMVYWVDIKLAQKKGLKFYQTRSNAIILLRYTPILLHPESCSDENWRCHVRGSFCVTSASSNDFFGTRMEKRSGFISCSTTRKRSCSTSKKGPEHPNQTKIIIMTERRDLLFDEKELFVLRKSKHVRLVKKM